MKKDKTIFNKTMLLIALCWLVYTCSYLGKLGYNANITQIETVYSISHPTAGTVSTFFFFAYGIGQILNGVFCKKYKIRLVVFVSLLVSGFMNFLVGISNNFSFVKYFWLINGAALSVLWPSLIRLLSETLDQKVIGRAVVVMGTTVAVGTIFVYGLSALFAWIATYTIIFYTAGVLLPMIALLWFFAYPKLTTQKPVAIKEEIHEENTPKKRKWIADSWFTISILAFFAIADNFIKDGLTTWVPMILKETYALPDSLSILLTIILPILAIFGTGLTVILHKKIKDFVTLSAILFLASTICIAIVILCLPMNWYFITLGSFGIISCLMAGVNNIITSMAPLYLKHKINAGVLAGILNGFCYLGSTLSSYGLGAIADFGGWVTVFWLLFAVCIAALLLWIFYLIITNIILKKSNA